MKNEIKVKKSVLFGEGILPIIVTFLIIPVYLINSLRAERGGYWIFILVLIAIIAFRVYKQLIPLLKLRIIIDDDMIKIRSVEDSQEFQWADIKYVNVEREKKKTVLMIETDEGVCDVPVWAFDEIEVFRHIKGKVSSEVLKEDGYNNRGSILDRRSR